MEKGPQAINVFSQRNIPKKSKLLYDYGGPLYTKYGWIKKKFCVNNMKVILFSNLELGALKKGLIIDWVKKVAEKLFLHLTLSLGTFKTVYKVLQLVTADTIQLECS